MQNSNETYPGSTGVQKKQDYTITVTPEQINWFDNFAKKQGRKRSEMFRDLIEDLKKKESALTESQRELLLQEGLLDEIGERNRKIMLRYNYLVETRWKGLPQNKDKKNRISKEAIYNMVAEEFIISVANLRKIISLSRRRKTS